jgi:hypothetical protein
MRALVVILSIAHRPFAAPSPDLPAAGKVRLR